MKVLYANPVFLDYRLAFYKELNRLLCGNLYLIYSKNRYKILEKENLYNRIKEELGENAIPLATDYLFDTYSMSFHMKDIEKGKHIPFTFGLLKKIRKINPDILITEGFFQWTPLVILYSILFHIPVYIGYERTKHTERNTGKLKTWHRKLTNKLVQGYFVNGSETQKYLMSIGIKKSKIHIGGMSADSKSLIDAIAQISIVDRNRFKREFQESEGLTFLFSGRLTYRKGLDYLLPAWKRHVKNHRNDILIIIGNGDNEKKYQCEFGNEKSIFWQGFVDYNQVYKYYAIADVFILPTLVDNWSLVIPEAMSCGLPVATSIYNGCHPELVRKNKNGITFDSYDEKSIIESLEYFHHQDLKQLGKHSIELEKLFNTENCSKRVYNVLINKFLK